MHISALHELTAWITSYQSEIDLNPAAFCAVEIALLEVLAQEQERSLEGLLGIAELSGKFQYTGVLGTRNPEIFTQQLQAYKQLGFKDYKLKIFADRGIDRAHCDALAGINDIRVRLDANNLWSDPMQAAPYIQSLDYPIWAIEEPLAKQDYIADRKLYDQLGIPIILDESFIQMQDFAALKSAPEAWVINLRISKMGGILRTLAIAAKCRQLDIPVIIGAHVGETSILTRAALTVAQQFRDILLAQEGAFGNRLLQYDLIEPSLKFARAGKLLASLL